MKQEEVASCPVIDVKVPTDSLLLKENSEMKVWKNCNWIKRRECIIPISCRHQSFYQSPSGKPRWEFTLPRYCWWPQPATASTALLWWWHDEDWNVTSFRRDALAPSNAWQKIRQRQGIQRFIDRRRHLLQASFQETQIKDWVLYQLVTVPTSQIFAVSVGQHMRTNRNSNDGRRTTYSSHNRQEHWQFVCGINGKAVGNGHSHPTESVLLPRSLKAHIIKAMHFVFFYFIFFHFSN